LKDLKNAWLNKNGKIVCEHPKFWHERTWHVELAECILGDLWKIEDTLDVFEKCQDDFNASSTEVLEKMGWIRLMGFGGMLPVWVIPVGYKLTKKQEQTILEWCMNNNRNFNNCFAK